MGNYISKEQYDLEQYKLILEIDELQREKNQLQKELKKALNTITTLQLFYNPPTHDQLTKDEFLKTWD